MKVALRSLIAMRWFTLGALSTFALGVGISVAVFAIVDAFLFRPLPFGEPDRLVTIYPVDDVGRVYFMFPKGIAVEVRRRSKTIADLAYAGLSRPYYLSSLDEVPLRLTDASFNVLDVLGVRPALGRSFTRDDAGSRRRLALLRQEAWRRRFGGDTAAVGRTLWNSRGPIDVVGILPADFIIPSINWTSESDGLLLTGDLLESASAAEGIPAVFGRLKLTATASQAQAELEALIASRPPDRPEGKRTRVVVERMQKGLFWNVRTPLAILFIGGSLIWLVSCANLATLMMARGRAIESQVAIQKALGASASRLIYATFAEVGALCAVGSILAVGAFAWTVGVLAKLSPSFMEALIAQSINARVLGFALIAAGLGTAMAGAYPAWRATRIEPQNSLRRSGVAGRTSNRGAKGLLAVETAIGTGLVLTGTLAIQSFWGLLMTDLGFEPRGLYALTVTMASPTGDVKGNPPAKDVLSVLRTQSVIASATAVDVPPAGREILPQAVDTEGRRFVRRSVAAQYFATMQTDVVAGRLFSDHELLSGSAVAVINEAAARLLAPGAPSGEAVGWIIRLSNDYPLEVIGVVADTRERHGTAARPEVFTVGGPSGPRSPTYLLRAAAGEHLDENSVRAVLQDSFGPTVRLSIVPILRQLEPWLQYPRLYAVLFGTFAVVSLLLAAIGLFAVASFEVAQRRYELAIRLALGAKSSDVLRLMLGEALRPVLIGLAAGYGGAYLLGALLQSLFHHVDARNPVMYLFVGAVFLGTAVLAVWRPTQRAGTVDPLQVLRSL
jgi:predicted permease